MEIIMKKTLSFIGCGNMAKAMIKGIIKSGFCSAQDIAAADVQQGQAEAFAEETGIKYAESNSAAAEAADIVFLCVKPSQLEDVCTQTAHILKEKTAVSIAAGVSVASLSDWLQSGTKIIRAMPNIPITVGEGMSVVCRSSSVSADETDFLISLFSSFGKAVLIEEDRIDAFTAIASSSPAMLFILLEAMADGGVMLGLSRADSYTMAAQAMAGAAQMVLQTKKHPAELKDAVCSPGGTTIEMVAVLENAGFRSAVIESMAACYEKCSRMQ